MQGLFLWHFPYLERVQGVLEEVPRGPTGPLGPLELAAPLVAAGVRRRLDVALQEQVHVAERTLDQLRADVARHAADLGKDVEVLALKAG